MNDGVVEALTLVLESKAVTLLGERADAQAEAEANKGSASDRESDVETPAVEVSVGELGVAGVAPTAL